MLRIGYVRLGDSVEGDDALNEAAALRALGCQVVRGEEPAQRGAAPFATLYSILDFIGSGDELVVGDI
jgi:hypothetical protein